MTVTEPAQASDSDEVAASEAPEADARTGGDEVTVDEVLVEEISIDGMCGVY